MSVRGDVALRNGGASCFDENLRPGDLPVEAAIVDHEASRQGGFIDQQVVHVENLQEDWQHTKSDLGKKGVAQELGIGGALRGLGRGDQHASAVGSTPRRRENFLGFAVAAVEAV